MATIQESLAVAVKYHQDGNYQEAERIYRNVLKADPRQVDALHLLGVLAYQGGKHERAIDLINQAIRINPAQATFHFNVGSAYKALGKTAESIRHLQEAVRLNPDYAEAQAALGLALKRQGRLDEAIPHYQAAIRLKPGQVESYNNLSSLYLAQRRLEEALELLREALRIKPDYPDAHSNLGVALSLVGRPQEALAHFQKALELRPDYAEAHSNLGALLIEAGKTEEAVKHCREAARLKPDYAMAYSLLGTLAAEGRYEFSDAELAAIRGLLESGKLSAEDANLLNFTLGRQVEKSEPDAAFRYYQRGNELSQELFRQRKTAFDMGNHRGLIERLMAAFNADFFQRVQGFGLDTEIPVFIVGMPRSGTTLVEQILASHPQAFGAGELQDIKQITVTLNRDPRLPGGYPACMALVDRETLGGLAAQHLEHLRQLGGDALRIIDKMPHNYLHLGLIAAMFPGARVIHCRRDPLDVCVSCYCQNFRDVNYASSLEMLGFYYRQYERLMQHWRNVLPLPIHDVVYEELVADQERVSRELVRFCGLDWDDRCLSFHETERAVQTASKVQVRKPIYASSVQRWKKFERHLQPLVEALAYWSEDGANSPKK